VLTPGDAANASGRQPKPATAQPRGDLKASRSVAEGGRERLSVAASVLSGGCAVVAGAAEDDVVTGDRVAGSALDLVQRPLELVVGERLHLATVVADEMVMMLAVGVDRLEAGRTGADVDPLDKAGPGQLLERAIDARDPNTAPRAAELIEDLLRGQAALLPPEQLDDRAAGAAVAVPLRL
jgi:hypothetical protein